MTIWDPEVLLEEAEQWLVNVCGFPFDVAFDTPPTWTTPERLAPLWMHRDRQNGVPMFPVSEADLGAYVDLIALTGWATEGDQQ